VPGVDDYIGKTVAKKYLVEQMIGEGGMGKVYKANQIALDKPVVLKVLRQALLSDARTVARFQREAKAASRLNHPNSISVLDFGQTEEGAMYIAMEYVQGRDLHSVLAREWPLPESRVIRIVGQMLSALEDAHSAGVIHRDLKPENIMVEQRRGEPDFVKVLDFGIAKIIDTTGEDGPALTRAGFVCGTPEYMSPEQARGAVLDHRSDLYAVGVILYQLVTGLLPFDSDSAVGFATKHLTEVPPLPSKRRPEAKMTAGMERLIMRAMAKKPDDRPQTAEQFRNELAQLERDRRAPVSKSGRFLPPPQAELTRKKTPLDQQETNISAPALAGKAPWAANEETVRSAPQFGPVPARNAATSAPTTAPDADAPTFSRRPIFVAAAVALVAVGAVGYFVLRGPSEQPVAARSPPLVPAKEMPLTELVLDDDARMPSLALQLETEGDMAWAKGEVETALKKYFEAWQKDTRATLSLKIGEICLVQGRLDDARAWWARFRRDAPAALATEYIDAVQK
jgi:eukaryotic-like serine/threonine-protein kinase